MAEVSRTDPGKDKEVMEFHKIPDLMTRVRMEHKLEALHRDRRKLESSVDQIRIVSEKSGRPPHKPLLDQRHKEIGNITEEMEGIIRDLEALNEGVNPEKEPE